MKKIQTQLTTKELAKKALKDKPKWKPSKGYAYCATIEPGELFETSNGTRGILLECNVNASVIITKHPTNDNYYLGKKLISANTEVKVIK